MASPGPFFVSEGQSSPGKKFKNLGQTDESVEVEMVSRAGSHGWARFPGLKKRADAFPLFTIGNPGATGRSHCSGGALVADHTLLDSVANAIRAEAENTRTLTIDANTRLVEDLDLDSIDIVGVTMRLEDRFHIEIDVEDIKHFRSVSDLIDQVSILLGKSAA